MTDEVQVLDERAQWKTREIEYISGPLSALLKRVPTFEFSPFRVAEGEPENPYHHTVVRLPLGPAERKVPVALVSKSYALVQHQELIEHVVQALEANGIARNSVKYELGLTSLGELMVFRAYLESLKAFEGRDGEKMALRLECVNSVDGTYRLVVLLGWFRFICLNGLVIGRSLTEMRQTHSGKIEWRSISEALERGLCAAEADRSQLARLEDERCVEDRGAFEDWVNTDVAQKWNKTAATKVFHATMRGVDVEVADAFSPEPPSNKPVHEHGPIPGAVAPCKTMYDVAQALSYVATRRAIFEDRLAWQAQIPDLLQRLREVTGEKRK